MPPIRRGGDIAQRTGSGWLAGRYRRFARHGMDGESEFGAELVRAVAQSSELLAFIARLPDDRRHPNLFLAAVRYLFGTPESAGELLQLVRRHPDRIRRVMMSRTTQTNEPARCTALVPLLACLPQPLAIVEVGASAGLCLLLDRYGYDFGEVRIEPPGAGSECPAAPIFPCTVNGALPYPGELPRVVWRKGLDLNPIDLGREEEVAWLEALVWPGQDDRAARLRGAIEIARRDPPQVVRGDLAIDLAALLSDAPKEATLVVFHTAVLQYVAADARRRFLGTVHEAGAMWISNEAPSVFPELARDAPAAPRPGRFLLMLDGIPVAWTGPHGQSIDWFGP